MSINKRHLLEYFIFLGVSVAFLILFFNFRYNGEIIKIMIAAISVFYPLWGIIHSAFEGRLTRLIVSEYVLFGVLVFLLLTIAQTF